MWPACPDDTGNIFYAASSVLRLYIGYREPLLLALFWSASILANPRLLCDYPVSTPLYKTFMVTSFGIFIDFSKEMDIIECINGK